MITQWFYFSSSQRFHGLSTDAKPTGCANGSIFIEIDTSTIYIYDEEADEWNIFDDTISYDDMPDKPQINGVTLVGNKTLAELGLVSPMVLKGRVDTVSNLPAEAEAGWVYLVGISGSEELEEYVYTADDEWQFLGYNTTVIDSALSTTSENPVQNKVITNALDGKVNTVTGKGLSTNDYTNAEKASVALSAEILTPISESAYEALTVKDKPLYFIYEDV